MHLQGKITRDYKNEIIDSLLPLYFDAEKWNDMAFNQKIEATKKYLSFLNK